MKQPVTLYRYRDLDLMVLFKSGEIKLSQAARAAINSRLHDNVQIDISNKAHKVVLYEENITVDDKKIPRRTQVAVSLTEEQEEYIQSIPKYYRNQMIKNTIRSILKQTPDIIFIDKRDGLRSTQTERIRKGNKPVIKPKKKKANNQQKTSNHNKATQNDEVNLFKDNKQQNDKYDSTQGDYEVRRLKECDYDSTQSDYDNTQFDLFSAVKNLQF